MSKWLGFQEQILRRTPTSSYNLMEATIFPLDRRGGTAHKDGQDVSGFGFAKHPIHSHCVSGGFEQLTREQRASTREEVCDHFKKLRVAHWWGPEVLHVQERATN